MKVIFVDADACPVKDEVVKIATRHGVLVNMVCNGGIRPFKNDLIKLIFPLQIIYPFYITFITVLSNLFSFNWKGRIQQK